MNKNRLGSPRETFLGFDIFEVRRTADASMFSRVTGYVAERRAKRDERVEARTLRQLKAVVRSIVAARRTGVLRTVAAAFLLIAGLSGCGKGLSTPAHYDSAFAPYVDEFNREANLRGGLRVTNVTIGFGDVRGGNEYGVCNWNVASGKSIVIDRSYWGYATEAQRTTLLFHELGHCVLGRDHTKAGSAFGIPDSIMYPESDLVAPYFASARTEYLNELFAGAAK